MRNKKQEKEEKTEREAVLRICAPYYSQINSTPALLSILYDIGLIPEQNRKVANAYRMGVFCEVFARLTPVQIDDILQKQAAEFHLRDFPKLENANLQQDSQ